MKYISILRGINVSGQKKIKMADLKALFEAHGFEDVTTYIQSGNVFFETRKVLNTEDLKKTIEKSIKEKYAFHVPVDICSDQPKQDTLIGGAFSRDQNLITDKASYRLTYYPSSNF